MMGRYSRKEARRSILHTATYRAVSQIFTVLSYVVMVRGMSEHDFGIFNIFYAILPLISSVASLGLEQTLRRYQPEYIAKNNLVAAAWLVRVVSRTRLMANIAVLGAIVILWNRITPPFHVAPYRIEFTIFCVLTLLYFQSRVLQMSLSSHMFQHFSVGSTALLGAGKLVAYLAFMWLGTLTLQNAIIADTAAYGLMYAVLSLLHRASCRHPTTHDRFVLVASERRRLFRYGIINNFNDAGTMVLGVESDNFFIAALMNATAVGAYSFYTRLTQMGARVSPTRLFDNVIQPLFFAIRASEAAERIPRYFSLLINISLMLQMPMMAYAAAYHKEIVQVLFAGKFVDKSTLLPLMMGFATFNVIGTPATMVAQYTEKVSVVLLSKVFAVYNVVTMLLLVPICGLFGAALSTGSSAAFKNLFIWWHVRGTARWTNAWQSLLTSTVVWGSCIATCYALKRVLHLPAIGQLACGAIICGAAALIYVRSPALSSGDREILASIFRGKERRVLRLFGVERT